MWCSDILLQTKPTMYSLSTRRCRSRWDLLLHTAEFLMPGRVLHLQPYTLRAMGKKAEPFLCSPTRKNRELKTSKVTPSRHISESEGPSPNYSDWRKNVMHQFQVLAWNIFTSLKLFCHVAELGLDCNAATFSSIVCMSSNSLHHTTFRIVAQAEMQEARAARWSCWYMKQLKWRESEKSQKKRAWGSVCHSTSRTIYKQFKTAYVYLIQIWKALTSTQRSWKTWPFSCMNVGNSIMKHQWSNVIIKHTHGSEKDCPTVYVSLWKHLFHAWKHVTLVSPTYSVLRPKLISIPSQPLLNV